jgi:uncharacterized protein (UPF0333 family)
MDYLLQLYEIIRLLVMMILIIYGIACLFFLTSTDINDKVDIEAGNTFAQ